MQETLAALEKTLTAISDSPAEVEAAMQSLDPEDAATSSASVAPVVPVRQRVAEGPGFTLLQ